MNAPNSLSQDQQAIEGKASDPSMEEILASIRRIIADDQVATTRPKEESQTSGEPPAPPAGVTKPNEDPPIETLHADAAPKSTGEPLHAAPQPRPETAETAESALREAVAKPEIRRVVGPEDFAALAREMRPPRPRSAPPKETAGPLVSPTTDAAVSASFNSLVASRFLQSEEQIEDMVRDMLRPMLKAWLDDNLPILVERLVRAEIERVARGR
jgi:cell pole-organizing protein PopZ